MYLPCPYTGGTKIMASNMNVWFILYRLKSTWNSTYYYYYYYYYYYPCFHLYTGNLQLYKACSIKDRTFAIKTLLYNILSTVRFKVVPSTGDTPFPTFLPLLECFLNRTFCDGAQFSYRIFLNLRMSKNKPNFLNSSPTSTDGALRLLSAPSGRF